MITRKERIKLKAKYVKEMNLTEGVDKNMIGESILNYIHDGINYKDKVCLDLGANVGGFIKVALDYGAKSVHAVDCDLRNFGILVRNFGQDKKVSLEFGAVTGSNEKTIELFKSNSGNNHCSTSMFKKKGFHAYDEVPNINMVKLLEEIKPDILKVDIESAEYGILDWIRAYHPPVLFLELHGNQFKEDMERWSGILTQEYENSEIEPMIVFKRHFANDCLFFDKN